MAEPVNFRDNLAEAWRAYRAQPLPLSLFALLALVCLPTLVLTGPGMLLLVASARTVRSGGRPGAETLKYAFSGMPDDYLIGLAYAGGVITFVPTVVGWLVAAVLLGPVFIIRAETRDIGIVEAFRTAIATCLEHTSDTASAAFAVIAMNVVALFGGGVGLLITLPLSALALVQLWEQWSGRSGGTRVEQVYDFRSSV